VRHPSRARLFAIGRLDMESTGLLLLTNDGELANQLTHPRYEVTQQYEITATGEMDEEAVERLTEELMPRTRRRAVQSSGPRIAIQTVEEGRTKLWVELPVGGDIDLREAFERAQHHARKIRCVQFGPLKLRGLKPGQWRDLMPKEIESLKHFTARRAGAK
jgi:23S rRNA pseudouridine2605 synthase